MTIEEIQAAIIENLYDVALYIKITEEGISKTENSTDPVISAIHDLNIAKAVGYDYIIHALNIREVNVNEKRAKNYS